MKFFALVALVGYTSAIRLSTAPSTAPVDHSFPVVEPRCPTVIPAANMTTCPGQKDPVNVSANTSGTAGIITDEGAVKNIRA